MRKGGGGVELLGNWCPWMKSVNGRTILASREARARPRATPDYHLHTELGEETKRLATHSV